MPNVSDLLCPSLTHDILPQRRLVKLRHFLKREVEILLRTIVHIKAHVVSGKAVAARIVEPEVEAVVDKAKTQGIGTLTYYSSTTIDETMLVNYYRFLGY